MRKSGRKNQMKRRIPMAVVCLSMIVALLPLAVLAAWTVPDTAMPQFEYDDSA
jgi:hypothetical protein